MSHNQIQPTIKNRSLRRILELDRPVPILSEQEALRDRDKNFVWNFFFNAADVTFFMSGISLLSATTILPLFISKLTNNTTVPLAIVAMLAQGGFFLPQLLTANFIERLDRKKPIVVNLGFLTERLPAICMVFTPLVALYSPLLALVLFLLIYTWFNIGGGVIAPAWQDLIARCFPVERRGRFFGGTMFLGALLGVGMASLAGVILERYLFPYNFVIIFGIAAAGIVLSWLFIAQTREPVEAAVVPERSAREYFRELPQILRRDNNFRNFLVARFVLSVAEMGSGFLTAAAISIWAISDGLVATYTTATLIGQTAGSLLMGFLADRYGHRLSLEISSVMAILSFGIAWLAPDPSWYLAVFFLLGFFNGSRIVSGMMVVLEFCPPSKRPTYVGIANTLAGIGSMAAPIFGAALVPFGYRPLFLISTLGFFIAFILLRFWVKEPRFELPVTNVE